MSRDGPNKGLAGAPTPSGPEELLTAPHAQPKSSTSRRYSQPVIEPLLSVAKVCEALGIARTTLHLLTAPRGPLPVVRLAPTSKKAKGTRPTLRYRVQDVVDYLDSCRVSRKGAR